MNQVIFSLTSSYILVGAYFLYNWLRFCLSHLNSSDTDKFLSFVIFIITTIFWPLAICMYLIKIIRTKKFEFETTIPIILVFFAFSISLYLS